MKRGTLVSLTTLGLALAILACRDLTSPLDRLGSASHLLNESGPVTVSPGAMHGWSFYNDQNDTPCTDTAVCRMVEGPAGQPLGSGSAFLSTPGVSDGKALVLKDYAGTRFDAITELRYSTFRQSVDSGRNLAIALQVNADYDLTDQSVGYQGRLVYEPYQSAPGTVLDTTWQSWDAKAGKWWGTKASVPRGGVLVTNPCVQATPCTWAQLLAAFPNVGIHTTYGAVVLKAGSSWPGFSGNVDALAIGVNGVTTTFDFEASESAAIPASAPDSIPTALWDSLSRPANVLQDPPTVTGSVIRDLIYVRFLAGTSVGDRQAAIDLVHGTVVGGLPLGDPEHFYAIRLPYVLGPGDSTSGPILRAQATLSQLPTVSSVVLARLDLFKPMYVRPHDGPGFTQWALSPDSAHGPNWGQIGVDAPFAWGCSTGKYDMQVAPSIAIVDAGFHDVPDLHANLGSIQEFAPANGTDDHGTAVASVVGAVGGNDSGMTGMLWKAKLDLYDITRPVNGHGGNYAVMQNLKRALAARPRVLNLSYGLSWNHVPGSHADSLRANDVKNLFAAALDTNRSPVTKKLQTLVVIAAGNEGADAYFNGFSALAEDPSYGGAMLVVAGTELVSTGHQVLGVSGGEKSNYGHLVDVAAPGWSVGALGSAGMVSATGTSFAAPMVTGIAGMLWAFDPALSLDDVRRLIINGAANGGRTVADPSNSGRPLRIVNAYQALQLAARRPGAPLCGNRVYAKGGQLTVARGDAPPETIGTIGTYTPGHGNGYINAKHGGRQIDVYAYPNNFTYEYTATGWTRTSLPTRPGSAEGDGGAFNGMFHATHDGDTLVYTRADENRIQLFVSDTVDYVEQAIGPGLALATLPTWTSNDCDYEAYMNSDGLYKCRKFNYERGRASSYTPTQSVVSPIDGSLYISVGFQTNEEVWLGADAGWFTCGTVHHQRPDGSIEDIDSKCRDTRNYRLNMDSLQIYRVDKMTGVFAYLGHWPGSAPTNLAISEDGRELLLSYQEASVNPFFSYSRRTATPDSLVFTAGSTNAACVTAAIPIQTSSQGISLGSWTEVARETGPGCPKPGSQFDLPTFAPIRAPTMAAATPLLPKPSAAGLPKRSARKR